MMAAPKPDTIDLAARVSALKPHEKLRMAAELLEARHPEIAHTIASSAVEELGAWLLLRKAGG